MSYCVYCDLGFPIEDVVEVTLKGLQQYHNLPKRGLVDCDNIRPLPTSAAPATSQVRVNSESKNDFVPWEPLTDED